MKRKLVYLLSAFLLSGCNATLTVHTWPEGALITEPKSGRTVGESPIKINYTLDKSQLGADGCYVVYYLQAQWRSGAVAQTASPLKFCGSSIGNYEITIGRPQVAGVEIDQNYAMQREMLRMQKQSLDDQRRAAANAQLLQWYQANKPQAPTQPTQCMRDAMGNFTCF